MFKTLIKNRQSGSIQSLTGGGWFYPTDKWKESDPRFKEQNQRLLEFVIRDNRPFSMVEDQGFLQYSLCLNPCYIPPSRRSLTKLIDVEYLRVVEIVKGHLKKASTISFTSDIWSCTVKKMSFISLTGHFLDADFKHQHFCLAGQHFPGTHSGVEIGGILRTLLLRDGASNYSVGARVRKFFSYFLNLSYFVLYHVMVL